MKSIKDINIEDKTIFLRVDWNVPLKNGVISNDNRIVATIPTIKYLQSKNCKIIIGTHLGRPEGETVHSLSTKILAKKLSQIQQFKVLATDDVVEPSVKKQIEKLEPKEILVLGNLRWHKEEEENNRSFAKVLASYADIYINDAFAVSHRAHASVEAITDFLPSYAGLLLEKEVEMLSTLTENPRKPFVIILGGAKIKDKIGLIKRFSKSADKILIGGAIAVTLKYYQGEDVSKSLFESNIKDLVKEIITVCGDKLIMPVDNNRKNLPQNQFSILDIGPKTVEIYSRMLRNAKTIFWNGNMGYSEEKEFENGTIEIAKAIRNNHHVKIVAGGDTVGFLDSHKMLKDFTFVSTGGGAALEFLAGIKLPGLKVLGYYNTNG